MTGYLNQQLVLLVTPMLTEAQEQRPTALDALKTFDVLMASIDEARLD